MFKSFTMNFYFVQAVTLFIVLYSVSDSTSVYALAQQEFGPSSSQDYLLPGKSAASVGDGHGDEEGDAEQSACPRFVHGDLRHSLTPASNASGTGAGGSGAQFDWLAVRQRPGESHRYWATGGLVTVPAAAAASVRVVLPLPGGGGGGGGGDSAVCSPGQAATVSETAARGNCAVAINAGLFDPASERCLGNLVSDGVVLHDSAGVKNAHFGVTRAGELFFGYLTEDQLTSGLFRQLVGGAIWLVRNGTNYVRQSIGAECSGTQTTGTLTRFATVISARSAVGQRLNGDLVLVQIVGKTDVAGINLFDLADLLISIGVYNAVNLDGGGSSTLVVNGTVVGSPSDYCPGPQQRHLACQRRVTSVLCVPAATGSSSSSSCGGGHPCSPEGGACVGGRCVCRPTHTGPGCFARCRCLNLPSVAAARCHPVTGDCDCPPGYRGRLCELPCLRGFYGAGCARVCVCPGGDQAACHHVNGTCLGRGVLDSNGGGGGGWTANGAYNLVMLVKQWLATFNWAVVILPAVLAASCLLNVCLLVRHCRLRRAAGRLQSRWRQQRHEMRRLVEEARGSSDESDQEAMGM